MSERGVELTADENRLMTDALAADGGCWDYEQCCWVSFEALRPVVAGILAARLADAEARAEAAVVEAINRARNEHWQKHLREHPYADATSCPGDYAAHDAYRHAAQVATEALRGDQ